MHRRRRILTLLVLISMLFASARAETPPPLRTPEGVRLRINTILAYEQENAPDFAETVKYDGVGGFDLCSLDGERLLEGKDAAALIRGQTDEEGRICEMSLLLHPESAFGREYCLEADRLCRVFLLAVFDSLTESELALLMDSYRYDIRPYHYSEGDSSVAERACMCEIELNDEIARIDSEAAPGDVISLHIAFLHDADEPTRSRAAENAWRIRRLAIAVSECEMIQTCGECLADPDAQNNADDIDALLALAAQSADAVCAMEREYMHTQEAFLIGLQEMCTRLNTQIGLYRAGSDPTGSGAQELLNSICSLCSSIGALPETLY